MRKDWKYILYLTIAFGLFVALKLLSPKQYDWKVTFAHDDKNPYGSYAFDQLLPTLFKGRQINHSYQTIYEIKDSLKRDGNLIIICQHFNSGKEDAKALLRHVSEGGAALIAANYFSGALSDTLEFYTHGTFSYMEAINSHDTTFMEIVNPSLHTNDSIFLRKGDAHTYFHSFDSTKAKVIARNDRGLAVALRIPIGKGTLIVQSLPLALTNIYLLSKENHQFTSSLLSYFSEGDIEWTEFYQRGRREPITPLRVILTTEPLAWAYYITLATLVIFMLFEMKRTQRIIPIIQPPENTSLEFVRTIGDLYFQSGEHKSIAEKKISFFFDHLRTKYWISPTAMDDHFVSTLSFKSGKPEKDIRALTAAIRRVQDQAQITENQLIALNQQLEKFYDTKTL